ncbi:MAG TPA: hypothetical protein VGG29_01725 [Caulobacteraceae bacterium]
MSGGHERQDAPPGLVLGALAGLLGLIGVGLLVAWGVAAAFHARAPSLALSGFERVAGEAPAPRLETDPRSDRLTLERRAQARLAGYGWTDRSAGLAHIPIDRAMALLAERGWPDPDTGPAATKAAQAPTPPAANAAEPAP